MTRRRNWVRRKRETHHRSGAVEDPEHAHEQPHAREPRDLANAGVVMDDGRPQREGQGRNPKMNVREKSDARVVPAKPGNKAAAAVADQVEERRATKEKQRQLNALRAQYRESANNALTRLRQAVRRGKREKFTTLLHHVSPERLKLAYWSMNRKAAVGVDGVTWTEYGLKLDENIADLHARIQRGAYRPQAARRAYIEKADGTQRPLGIAAVEDKIVQGAMVEVLNVIYEEKFFEFCYGYRPGRSAHDALDALAVAIERKKVNWVLDADIRGFFDSISHEWMQKFIEHWIGDRRVVRLVMRWLKAGVLEADRWSASEEGTPQGATISPLLANIYLFYVFDTWAHHWRRTQSNGDVVMVRYADDFVVGFEREEDARDFKRDLTERLGKFALELHPEKTRIVEFGRFAAERRARRGVGKPETFTFLGMTHVCTKNRRGQHALRRKTDRKRLNRKLHEIKAELRKRRHDPIPAQGQWLQQVVRGYDNHHAVPGNSAALRTFRRGIERMWLQSLRRRSQRTRVTYKRLARLSERWLPRAKILHPWPNERFNVKYPR